LKAKRKTRTKFLALGARVDFFVVVTLRRVCLFVFFFVPHYAIFSSCFVLLFRGDFLARSSGRASAEQRQSVAYCLLFSFLCFPVTKTRCVILTDVTGRQHSNWRQLSIRRDRRRCYRYRFVFFVVVVAPLDVGGGALSFTVTSAAAGIASAKLRFGEQAISN